MTIELAPPEASGPPDEKQCMTPKAKILVVDDEPDMVDLISYNLVERGYEVFTAHNGLQALHKIRCCQPDLVLLDLMMPGMDGYTVCEIMRHKPSTARIPVILITALVGEITRVHGLTSGADDYVTKPFSPEALVQRVDVLLHARQSGKPQVEAALEKGHRGEGQVAQSLVQE